MFRKIRVLLYILCLSVFLVSCGKVEKQVLKSDYVDTEIDFKAGYCKGYLLMDCCDEWNEFVDYCKHIKDASYIEGFEFYLYNDDGEEIKPKREFTVTFYPTEDFKTFEDETVVICSYPEGVIKESVLNENGSITFKADRCGMYIAMGYKTSPNEVLWISNGECEGQCRTCSDEW